MAQRVSAVSCLFREEEALSAYWEGLQHCLPLYPVIFVSPASNLQDSETFPSRMLLAKVCFHWHLAIDDFSLSTMYTHTEGNRSSRPNVISPAVTSLDTRVITSPAIYIYVARFINVIYTLYTQRSGQSGKRQGAYSMSFIKAMMRRNRHDNFQFIDKWVTHTDLFL